MRAIRWFQFTLMLPVLLAACTAGPSDASSAVPVTPAGPTTVTAQESENAVDVKISESELGTSVDELDFVDRSPRSGQFGVCGDQGVDSECFMVGSDDHRVQIAVVKTGDTGPTRLLLPGGPGQDLTRSASFDPSVYGANAGTLIVLGEPNSLSQLGKQCRAVVQAFADQLIGYGDDQQFNGGADLATDCRSELKTFAWEPETLQMVGSFLSALSIDEVYAVSFGARMLQALSALEAVPDLQTVVLSAPTGAANLTLDDLASYRARRTAEIVCANAELCVVPTTPWAPSLFFAAMLNVAYAWNSNESAIESMDRSSPEYLQAIMDAARALVFVDPGGEVDPQLLSYLAIQCSAYDPGQTAPGAAQGPESGFFDILSSLFQVCEDINDVVSPLPSSEIGSLAPRMCAIFSSSDPVAGRAETESYGLPPAKVVDAGDEVAAGHWPHLLVDQMSRSESQCL